MSMSNSSDKECFNSRSRVGSDLAPLPKVELGGVFQFTLPRGERRSPAPSSTRMAWFQFTLPRGERQAHDVLPIAVFAFQFTLPRGERPLVRAHAIV